MILYNHWIVPYNKLLCKILNVEYCSSIKAIRCITKYVNNGSDMDTFVIGNGGEQDVIKHFKIDR